MLGVVSRSPLQRTLLQGKPAFVSIYTPLSVRLASTSSISDAPGVSKVYNSANEAVKDIRSGSIVLSSGFGLCGTPDTLIKAISENEDIQNLTCVSNNAGVGQKGLGRLLHTRQIGAMISSFIGSNKYFEEQYLSGKVKLSLCPQGSIAEKCRAGAFGIPAFYTPTGYGTAVQTGDLVARYEPREQGSKEEPKPIEWTKPKEVREFNGKQYILEEAINADVAIVHVWKADEMGNCVFRYAANNFGPVFAKNAKLTIVEAEEIVPVGTLDSNFIQLPSIYVDRIVKATEEKQIELMTIKEERSSEASSSKKEEKSEARKRREYITRRAAKELRDGDYVNLGVGMPSLVPSFLPEGVNVVLHSENGILGMGPYPTKDKVDGDLVNAGKETVTLLPGAACFDSSESFGMIRGGKLDVTMLGALQVDAFGNLANWTVPGKKVSGFGGAMDLVSNPEKTKVVVLMDHADKNGRCKLVQETKLPLTGARCVKKIITDRGVFDVDAKRGLTLIEIAPGVDLEKLKAETDATFAVSENLIRHDA